MQCTTQIIINVTSIKWEWFCRCTIHELCAELSCAALCSAVFVLSALINDCTVRGAPKSSNEHTVWASSACSFTCENTQFACFQNSIRVLSEHCTAARRATPRWFPILRVDRQKKLSSIFDPNGVQPRFYLKYETLDLALKGRWFFRWRGRGARFATSAKVKFPTEKMSDVGSVFCGMFRVSL